MAEIRSRNDFDSRQGTGRILLPDFVFDPEDDWTRVFQKGLSRLNLSKKCVYEVGVGSGCNATFLLRDRGVSRVVGSDIDPQVLDVAWLNVKRCASERFDAFVPIQGSVDLLDSEEARTAVSSADVVIASIPQIVDVGAGNHRVFSAYDEHEPSLKGHRLPDHSAHYYDGARFRYCPFNPIGQGLNEALLKQVRDAAPNAEVALVLSARVGLTPLLQMFRENGFQPDIVYEEMIPQCPKTSISFFVGLETALKHSDRFPDFVCRFFGDPDGSETLSAARAEQRLAAPSPSIFHRLYVIRGRQHNAA